MEHSLPLISTLAVAFGMALVLGLVAVRLKLPALVGYLLAGILIGPATPGFVADVELSKELAEIGVMLLMFGVGLHFSFADLVEVRRIAVPGALVRILVVSLVTAGVAGAWGWSFGAGLILGLALSVSSTVVLLRTLEAQDQVESLNGRIAIGWLLVEDLAMILVLVLLPPLAGALGGDPGAAPADGSSVLSLLGRLGLTLLQLAIFLAFMLLVGKRVFPWLLWQVAKTGSRELFTLSVIAAGVSIAFGAAAIFGVSFALGAFLAGMILRESELSHRAAEESLPLRDAFAVLFFVSVGMLFDPGILLAEPGKVILVVGLVVLGKALVTAALLLAGRYPLATALTLGTSLAQIGEFSFILASLGVSLELLPPEGQGLVLAGAIASIGINPLLVRAAEPLAAWARSRSALGRALERRDDPLAELPRSVPLERLSGHVVLVGYGRVGRRIGEALLARGVSMVVAEENRELAQQLRDRGIAAVCGDASEAAVLVQAHLARARLLVIATPDTFRARKMLEIARTLRPSLETVVRSHSDEEAALLESERAGRVFYGEHELALGMTRHVLERVGLEQAAVEPNVQAL